jgi:hypothetical protein
VGARFPEKDPEYKKELERKHATTGKTTAGLKNNWCDALNQLEKQCGWIPHQPGSFFPKML